MSTSGPPPARTRASLITLIDEPLPATAGVDDDGLDRRDGRVYDYDDDTLLAIEVALTSGRPLLLRGDPGCGKSSLAAYVARNLGWRYYEHVVTAATRAEDLLWRYDAVRRLSDATRGKADLGDAEYVDPGPLWWVFDQRSATTRGTGEALERGPVQPNAAINEARRHQDRAVLLIDELDKADPDVPNGLLVPLGSARFRVAETGVEVAQPPRPPGAATDPLSRLLVMITTNEERELPPAFLRRCVVHRLEHPNAERLVMIARRHLAGPDGNLDSGLASLCEAVAERVSELRSTAKERGARPPSTAEFLDAVRACRSMGITVGAGAWSTIERVTLSKDDRLRYVR